MSARGSAIVWDLIARDRASRTILRVGESFTGLERRGTAVGAALRRGLAVGATAVAGIGAVSIRASADFEASMTKISTQAGGTQKDVKVLSEQVLKLGGKVQQAPKELAGSLYHLKSVGMDNVDAMKALKTASDLAAVGGSDLEDTTNALAGAWRTGIKGATSFGQAAATVNSIIGAGNMTMTDFTDALSSGILPTAKTFGLSLQQVGSALALFTDEGVPASDAATRLRMSISLLGAPSGAAEKQLKKIGLTGLDLAKAMRGKDGIIGAIQLLKDHLDRSGMSAAEQSQVLSRAFGGGKSSSGILSMVSNLDVLKQKQDQVNRSAGRYPDAVKQQRKTALAQWHLLTGGLETLSVRIGTKVLPPVTGFVSWLNSDAFPIAAKFGRKMGALIPVGEIKKRFDQARTLVSDFFAGLSPKKTPRLPVPMLKAPAAPASIALPKAPTSDAQKMGQQIRDAISGGLENLDWSKVGATVGKGLGSAFKWIVGHGAELTKDLGQAIGAVDWVDVGKQFGKIALPTAIGFVNNLFEPLFHKEFWKKHWLDTILAVLSVIPIGKVAGVGTKLLSKVPWGKMGDALAHIPWGKIIPFGEKLAAATGPLLRGISEFVGRLALRFGEAFAARFPKVAEWFGRELSLLPTRLGVLGVDLARWAGRAVVRLGDSLVSHIPGAGNRFIRTALKAFGRFSLYQTGLNLAKSLLSGIWGRMKDVGSWLNDHVVHPVVHWVESGFGIASPSKVFTSIGRNLIAGLRGGIAGAASGVGSWVWSHTGKPIVSGFRSAGSVLRSKGGAFISGMKSGIVGAMRGIGSWVKSRIVDPVVGAVKHFFGIKSPSRVFMAIGGHLVGGLLKGMAKTSGSTIAKKVFGSMPKALAAIAKKGLVSLSSLPGKALKALGGLGGDLLGLLGLGGGGGGGGSSANQKIGQVLASAHGWSGPQWAALKNLWNGESGWNEHALNKSSGAYGIPQALPASKMASAGSDWKTNASTQIKWGLSYIASRYGSPLSAYSAWLSRSPHWYAKGTRGAAKGLAWVGEKGAELVNFGGGEDVLNHEDSIAFARSHGIRLPGYASGTITNAADRVARDKKRVQDAQDDLARAKRRHKGVLAAEKKLQAAQKELQAAEISLKNAKRNAKISISNTIATGLLKKLETGTSSAIASAIKSLATKLLNAGYNKTAASIQKKGSRLESLADKRASVQKTIAAANQYASDQAGTIRDFLSISGTSATDVGSLISSMTGQQKTASGFVSLEKSLKARGASKDLLAQLAEAGPGSQLATILGQKSVTTQDIGKLNKLVASGGKLATSFGRDMADLMYDTGKHAGDGFLAGLKATEKDLQKQINKLAKDLVSGIKKALKIKSPSGVFRDEVGRQVALGMVVGMDQHRPHIAAAAQRMATTARKAAASRSFVPLAGSRSAGRDQVWARVAAAMEQQASQPQQLTGQLVLESGELLGVIKGTVQPMIREAEHRMAHRATVGRR